jgi:hypothetical protein
MFDAMKEFHKEADAAALSLDKSHRAFAIQTGEFGPKGKEALHGVHEGGEAAAISHADAEALYGDLKRKGFDSEEILKHFASIAADFAVNRTAAKGNLNTEGFADAMAKSLDRNAKKDGAALLGAGQGLYAMTAGTEATASDVSEMAKTLASLKGGKGEARHAAGLAKLGLNFGDVDLIGEDMSTAMQRMSKGLQRLKPEDRMGTLKNITGDADQARRMLSAIESMAKNDKNYANAVATQTGGLAAAKARAAGKIHHMNAEAGGDFDIQLDAAEIVARQAGIAGFTMGTRRDIASALRAMGSGEDNAIKTAFFGDVGGGLGLVAQNSELMAAIHEQTELLKASLTEQQKANEHHEKAGDKARGRPARKAAE